MLAISGVLRKLVQADAVKRGTQYPLALPNVNHVAFRAEVGLLMTTARLQSRIWKGSQRGNAAIGLAGCGLPS